jgi:RNAse (barnase) inhibitor barstar
MEIVRLDTNSIVDWTSFHRVFADLMGFPHFYGMNMNAWIDCMSSLDDSGMTRFALEPHEQLTIEVLNTEQFAESLPEIFTAFITCTAFVNQRYLDSADQPVQWAGQPVILLAFT